MTMRRNRWWEWVALTALLQLIASAVSVTTSRSSNRRVNGIDVHELSSSLFSYREDPFAEEDRWAALSDSQRAAWTSANQVLRHADGVGDVLRVTKSLKETGISVHVDVQIVAADGLVSLNDEIRIKRYATAMRAGREGTTLTFNVSVAPQRLYKRISMHSPRQDPAGFMGLLDQAAATMGFPNALFVIVNHGKDPINEYTAKTPFVGTGRTAWVVLQQEKGTALNIAEVLVATERAAERVFAPAALYFPLPLVQDLRVELAAYSPGHEHRAQWLESFAWEEFEAALRGLTLHGQLLRFSSLQTNTECAQCGRAFRDLEKASRDFAKKAALALNFDKAPNSTWVDGVPPGPTRKRVAENTFRLFVVDTVKLRKGEALHRLESRPLSSFPGMGVIVFRSSEKRTGPALELLLRHAFVAGVYGITEPSLYIRSAPSAHKTQQTQIATVMFDVVARNLVRSVVETRISALNEIVEGILYFDVDPAKSLGYHEYTYLTQRINLMLFKLRRAQEVLGDTNDGPAALHMAASTSHDIRAIRAAFDLDDETKTFERFRDPTLRCHFSRLKREALRASQFLESSYPGLRHILIAVSSFATMTILANLLLGMLLRRKLRGKRE